MKLSLGEIWNLFRSDTQPLNKLTTMVLPIKTAYKIVKITKKLNDEFQGIEEMRVKLVRKYAEEAPEGEEVPNQTVKPENVDAFIEEFSEFLSEEIEIDVEPIKLDDLGKDADLTAAELSLMEKLIVE